MSIQITGSEYGTWWYKIMKNKTTLSTDKGKTWTTKDMGWSLPSRNWLPKGSVLAGSSPLNWMKAQIVDWWKFSAPNGIAATWIWMNRDNKNLPLRMMFGGSPPSPTTGDPKQLGFFQNYSFTYFPSFEKTKSSNISDNWHNANIEGFVFGNPQNFVKPIWNSNFGMTTFMTPVNKKYNPLPTRVLYKWKDDEDYQDLYDRVQNTVMQYTYNPNSQQATEVALQFGVAPGEYKQPSEDTGTFFSYVLNSDQTQNCSRMPLGQEPPNWFYIKGVNGTLHATVTDNSVLGPNETVMIMTVLFPPSDAYPQGRYLWTWYSLLDATGKHSRPITFMESGPSASAGADLSLADYFDYKEFNEEISSDYFTVPNACQIKNNEPLLNNSCSF